MNGKYLQKKVVALMLILIISFTSNYIPPFTSTVLAAEGTEVVIIIPGISATAMTINHDCDIKNYYKPNEENPISHTVWPPHNIAGVSDILYYGPPIINTFITHDIPLLSCDYLGLPINTKVEVEDRANNCEENTIINQFYGDLAENLIAEGKRVYYFGYDWRLDNSVTAILLEEFINSKMTIHEVNKVSIVAHSMGGLVAAKYISKGNANKIDKLVTIATPYFGAPKALYIFETGNFLGGGADLLMASQLKSVAPNFKSVYQLLPCAPYFTANNSYYIQKHTDKPGWLTGDEILKLKNYSESKTLISARSWANSGHIASAENFHESLDLYNTLWSVDSYFIIGDKEPTIGTVKMQYDENGIFQKAKDLDIINGDGTVPIISAQAGAATNVSRRYYVNGSHSDLPSQENVIQQVQYILNDQIYDVASGVHTTPQSSKKLKLKVECPVNLNVYDSNGNHLGLTPEGLVEQDIESGSFYVLEDTKIAFLNEGSYNVQIDGTDNGIMTYTIDQYDENDNITKTIEFKDVNITPNTKITSNTDINSTITLKIDGDGNGTIDSTMEPSGVIENPGGGDEEDTTAPSLSIDIDGVTGDDGWYKSDTIATVSAEDSESGIDRIEYNLNASETQTYNQPINISDEQTNHLEAAAFNNAGMSSGTQTREIKIDKTAPTITYNTSGVVGDDGWFKSDVTLTVNSNDNLSGVRKIECSTNGLPEELYSQPLILTQEAINNITSKGTDIAGNVSGFTPKQIKIDKTAPTISYNASGVVGNNGWFKSDVTLTISSEDNLSGVRKIECSTNGLPEQLYSNPLFLTQEGINNIMSKGTDIAGNVSSLIPKEIKIDKTFPIVNIDTPINPKCGDAYTLSYSVFDAISGVASTNATINGEPIEKGDKINLPQGDTEIKVVCEDIAGNITTKIATISLPLNITAVSGGDMHSVAVNVDGSIWTWGNNDHGQLGDGTKINKYKPIVVKGLPKVTKVAAGGDHTLALDEDGNVWAWGNDEYGQLGVGDGNSNKYRSYPIKINSINNIIDISAGEDFSLAVRNDGTVWAWGYNAHGQLGNGNTTESSIPLQVTLQDGSYLSDIKSVSAGQEHSAAVSNGGNIYVWGYNFFGQLGTGNVGYSKASYSDIIEKSPLNKNLNIPYATLAEINNADQVECGSNHTIVIKKDGSIYGCGLGIAEKAVSIVRTTTRGTYSSKYDSSMFLRISNRDGSYSSGPNDSGPILIPSSVTGEIENVVDVGAGYDGMVNSGLYEYNGYFEIGLCTALTSNGQVYNYDTYVGSSYTNRILDGPHYHNGSYRANFVPVKTGIEENAPVLDNIVSIDSGSYHTLAINNVGRVFSWGVNYKGQLGLGSEYNSNTPYNYAKEIIFDTDMVPSIPKNISVIPFSNKVTLSWQEAEGAQEYDVEADGSIIDIDHNNVYELSGLTPNTYHTFRVRARNFGGTSEWSQPITVLTRQYMPNDLSFTDIASGGNHSIALNRDGTVWAWGRNNYGQLGDGTIINRNSLVQVRNLTNIVEISAGEYFSMALDSNGNVWAWGSNDYGQIGNNSISTSYIPYPVKVQALANVSSISAGGYHSLAVKSDGTVWAWGYNNMGQLGNGTKNNSNTPVQVIQSASSPLLNIKSVTAGIYHSVAQTQDNNIYTWGHDYYGQLGDGNIGRINDGHTEDKEDIYSSNHNWNFCSVYPKCVINTGDVDKVSAKYYHTVFIKNDGAIYGFGRNVHNVAEFKYLSSMSSELRDSSRPFKLDVFNGEKHLTIQQGYFGLVYSDQSGSFDSAIDIAPGADYKNSNQLLAALKADGTVWNYYSILSGTSINYLDTKQYYTQVMENTNIPLTNVLAIDRGNGFTIALKNDGSIWAWGVNTNGELGDGTNTKKDNAVETTFFLNDAPFTPINLTVSQTDASKITVSWTPIEGVEEYEVEINGIITESVLSSNYVHSNILSNTQYTYRVRSKNERGVSDWSIPVVLRSLNVVSLATNAVVTAENTKAQVDVDSARTLVDSLPDGTDKTNLIVRLNAVQAIIDATVAVASAETLKNQSSVDSAKALVNALPTGTDKTNLMNRLNAVQTIMDVEIAVTDAETVKNQSSVDSARALVNALPEGNDKTNYIIRLNAVQAIVDAIAAVAKAESTRIQSDVDSARILVSVLPDNIDKTNLIYRLDEIQDIINTYNIAVGADFTLVKLSDGKVNVWGRNSYGQLGLGDKTNRNTPTLIPGLEGVKQLSAGNAHVLALMEDGTVRAWGYNVNGQLGLGNVTNISTPSVITGLTGVKQVIAGYDHSLALMNDGTVKAWGNNSKGQLGLGDMMNRDIPTVIPGLSGVVQIVAGLYDSFALMNDGSVKAWGANDYGKLGTGDTSYTYKNTPVTLDTLSEVKQLAAGYDHVLSLMQDGTVKAWGNNGQGRLGLGDSTNRSNPTVIPTLIGVKQLAAGRLHSLAYLENGNLLAWGANPYGHLGVGDTTGRTTPTVINGLTGIKQIAIGSTSQHTIVIMSDGNIKTWGYNYYGQLGLGDTTNRNIPTDIVGFNLQTINPLTVKVYNVSGKISDASTEPIVTTGQAPNTQVPTAPENIICLNATATTVDLMWDSSIDNVGVTGYIVYRDEVEIGTTTTTEYTDINLNVSTTYIYSIKAYNESGNTSEASTEISITTEN